MYHDWLSALECSSNDVVLLELSLLPYGKFWVHCLNERDGFVLLKLLHFRLTTEFCIREVEMVQNGTMSQLLFLILDFCNYTIFTHVWGSSPSLPRDMILEISFYTITVGFQVVCAQKRDHRTEPCAAHMVGMKVLSCA